MVEVTGLFAFSIAVPCLFLLLSLLFTFHALYSIKIHWEKHSKKLTITWLTISSMCLFTFCMIWCVTHVMNPFAKNPENHATISAYSAYIAFNFGTITMFLLFLAILHYSFAGTRHDYAKWIKILYIFFAAVVPIFSIILDTYENWISYNKTWYLVKQFTQHINQMILSVFAAYLFMRALYRVAWKGIKHSDGRSETAMNRATKLVDSFTKYTILVFFVVIFGLIVLTMVMLTVNGHTLGMKPESWFLLLWIIYYMDCFMNVLCIYLRFEFAAPIYYKLCGKCCHRCCRNSVVESIKWKKRRYTMRSNDMEKAIEIHHANHNGIQKKALSVDTVSDTITTTEIKCDED
eukprot:336269_1